MDESAWTASSTVELRNLQKAELELESLHTPFGVQVTKWEHLQKVMAGFPELIVLVALDISAQGLLLVLAERQNR